MKRLDQVRSNSRFRKSSRRAQATFVLERLEERSMLTGDPTTLAPSLGAPPSPSTNQIWVSNQSELQNAFSNLKSGQTIVIQPGTYNLTNTLYVGLNSNITNVTIRGATDNFNDVVLLGKGMDNTSYGNVPMGISIWNAQNVTIANLSIGQFYYHPIEIKGAAGASMVSIYHVRLFDAGEQFIKVSSTSSGLGTSDSAVSYSLFEYTAGTPTTDHGGGVGYTNGISLHTGQNWLIAHNLFRNLHTPDSATANLWNPAVLVWDHSSNVIVEGNTFINTDRAIAFGLVNQSSGYDNQGGIIRNNFIYQAPGLFSATRAAASDGQILVWDSPNTQVLNNTILTDGNSANSIQLRWTTTGAVVQNNLADASIVTRNGATYTSGGNYLSATSSMFVNPSAGDLHLVLNSATQANVIDKVAPLSTVTTDWDGDTRPLGSNADIGADEYRSTSLDTTPPTVSGLSPASKATGVAVGSSASATFSEAVQSSTIVFSLKNSAGTAMAGSVSYNATTRVVTLTPSANLAYSTTYTASLSGAKDAAGNTMSPVSWSFTTGAASTTSGLVAAYSFNEGSGNTIADASGNGNTGTINGATWTTAGKYGSALSFNGSSNWVTVADAAGLDLTTGMTLEAWVSPSAINGWETVVLKERSGGLAYALYGGSPGGPPAGYLTRTGTTSDIGADGATAIPLNAWTHLATTFDGSTIRLYVNGSLVSSQAASGSILNSSGALRIGGNSIWGEYFSGLIDEIRIYNRPLTQAELQSDMNSAVSSAPDTTPPTITNQNPGNSSSGVSITTNAVFTFSEPVQANTINFTLKTAAGVAVPATVTYDPSTLKATLAPTSPLAYSTTYTATMTGAKDLAGNTMAGAVSETFTTLAAPAPDTTAPTVTAKSPASGATGVATSTSITATFSEAVQAGTISFVLKDSTGNIVGSTTTYNSSNQTATLTPVSPMAFSSSYSVAVSGAKDLVGNAMASPVTWSFSTGTNTSPSQLPLLYQSSFQYVGAFRIPTQQNGASSFVSGGRALAYNPANNSLFAVGHPNDQAIAEISIPNSIVNSTNVNDLATATFLQPFSSILNRIPYFPSEMSQGGYPAIGGLMVNNGQLIGTVYNTYDATGSVMVSHFKMSSLNLASSTISGLYQVGDMGGGYVGGFMTSIPTEWQSALGATALTGLAGVSITSRTSAGPAAFGFDPQKLSSGVNPAIPYAYYPLTNPLGGSFTTHNSLYDANGGVTGVIFPPGTSTVLFYGSVGTNAVGYGEAATYNDPYRIYKGYHSQNGDYAYQMWAYNANDLLAVKNGQKQPWEVLPYANWTLAFPQFSGECYTGGAAFDPGTGKLYVSQLDADLPDRYSPTALIQVFQLKVGTASSASSEPSTTLAASSLQSTQPTTTSLTMTSTSSSKASVQANKAKAVSVDSRSTDIPAGTGQQDAAAGMVPRLPRLVARSRKREVRPSVGSAVMSRENTLLQLVSRRSYSTQLGKNQGRRAITFFGADFGR